MQKTRSRISHTWASLRREVRGGNEDIERGGACQRQDSNQELVTAVVSSRRGKPKVLVRPEFDLSLSRQVGLGRGSLWEIILNTVEAQF